MTASTELFFEILIFLIVILHRKLRIEIYRNSNERSFSIRYNKFRKLKSG